MPLMQIAALAAAASPDEEKALLHQLWESVYGSPPSASAGGDVPVNLFLYMLDCRAFESAAIMLLPYCGRYERPWFWRMGRGSVAPGWAHINRVNSSHCDTEDESTGWAQTPALAMIAAIASARHIWSGRSDA